MLDERIREFFTPECFTNTFKTYKEAKTDLYTKTIKIQMGVDGIDWKNFERGIDTIGVHTCRRVIQGRYFFSPFREIEVPKPPYTKLRDARRANKTRTLSVGTIRDVIFQKMLYEVIEDYCEDQFNQLNVDVSYAYRRGKSAPLAVKQIYYSIVNEGYIYALDGDIKKFFDEIPHDKLFRKLEGFFAQNHLVTTYLKRFSSADRVEYSDYNGAVKKYCHSKPKRTVRQKGIPQGGVLSGLVANIYLNDFDSFIVNRLYFKYGNGIKYFRYADDFIILFKSQEIIRDVYDDIKAYLIEDGLEIHDIGEKTKEVNLLLDKLDFLGFSISPKSIRIRKENIEKFKKRMIDKINKSKIYQRGPRKGMDLMIQKIRFKVLGSGAFDESLVVCEACGKRRPSRSWLRYFLTVTDVRQLRALDTWIRKVIYHSYYNKVHSRLEKDELLEFEIPSLVGLYFEYRKETSQNTDSHFCHCDASISKFCFRSNEVLVDQY